MSNVLTFPVRLHCKTVNGPWTSGTAADAGSQVMQTTIFIMFIGRICSYCLCSHKFKFFIHKIYIYKRQYNELVSNQARDKSFKAATVSRSVRINYLIIVEWFQTNICWLQLLHCF